MRHLVAIPVFNEARHLAGVLEAVRAQARDVLIINDGSTDDTPRKLRGFPDVHVITHPRNLGYGQSLIDAFSFASERGYDWVITMDCDEQHEPTQIPDFLSAIDDDEADVVSGSRYLASVGGDSPPVDRLRINRTINDLLAQVLQLELTDSFCGFKAHRTAAMERLRLDESGYAFPLQFWVQCVRAGLTIREIPVQRIYRDHSREFGGALNDPSERLRHYLSVFLRALHDADAESRQVAVSRERSAEHIAATGALTPCSCGD